MVRGEDIHISATGNLIQPPPPEIVGNEHFDDYDDDYDDDDDDDAFDRMWTAFS